MIQNITKVNWREKKKEEMLPSKRYKQYYDITNRNLHF